MESATATPAPAAPVASPAPQTITAVDAAVSKTPSDYRAAKRAERAGNPLPAVSVTPDPAAAPAPDPATREAAPPPAPKTIKLTQDELNERTRRAVESALADFKAKAATPPAVETQPAAPAPPAEKFPTLDQWAEKNPGKTFDDYLDARDTHREEQRTKAEQVEKDFKARAEDLTTRGHVFSNAMGEAVKADPDLATKIPPAMRDPQKSVPLSALSPEQLKTATFSNLVAEAAFRSANGGSGKPAELLKYLHAHQDETVLVAEIARRDGVDAALGALAVIDRRLVASAAAPAPKPKPKTVTDAPAPLETLGSRPSEVTDPVTAAVRSGNTRAYRQLRRQERAANLIGRR
jgi:hypothetical protein